MPGCAFRSEGAASAPGGGGRARVGGGEGGGPLAGAGAGGSAAPRPRPAPPRRHFAGGCRGDQSRLSGGGGQCGTQARRQNGNPASCSQVRAGPPRPPPPGPRGRPCRAGSRGARRAHEAGLARPPRAVIGPAERPAPPTPALRGGARGCLATSSPRRVRSGPQALTPTRLRSLSALGPSGRAAGSQVRSPRDPSGRHRLLPGPRPPRLGVAFPSLCRRRFARRTPDFRAI